MKEGKSFEMAIKIHLRRFTSLFLCCVLVFCSIPVQVHATDPVTAASLAITGGQLAGAGLSGEAALSLAGPVGAVVGVTLGAVGLNTYVSQAAQQAGKSRTRYVLDKLVIWGAQAGYTQEQLYTKIAQGISVAADGTIQLTKDVSQMISQFGSWAFTQGEETVVPELPAGDTFIQFGDYKFASIANGYYPVTGTYTTSSGTITSIDRFRFLDVPANASFLFLSGGTQFVVLVPGRVSFPNNGRAHGIIAGTSNAEFSINFGSSGRTFVRDSNGVEYTLALSNEYRFSVNSSVSGIYSIDYNQLISEIAGKTHSIVDSSAVDEVFIGQKPVWDENKDVLNPSADDTPVALNPDLLNPIIDSLTDGQQATMSIIDYLQALQDAWDHALDDVQTAIGTITDSLTGIQEQIAVPQTAVENPTVTNPSVTPDTTPIINPSDVDPGTAITGLSFDLTNIFPFCIPFDIYAALNLLDAEPVAPSYHFHLEWPYNIVIDFTLDLSPFDQVAAVARTMEILLFIIGLAVMTRSMFIRG